MSQTPAAPVADPSSHWPLLVRACRSDVGGLASAVALAGGSAADWAGLLSGMDRHGVGPLAASALLSVDDSTFVPEGVRQLLHERIRLGSLRERILVPELLGILDALSARGLEAVAYKGPALAALAYGRVALRESVDLDVVVREHDASAAAEVLRGRGYRRWSPPEVRPRLEAAWRAGATAAEFVSADGWLFVDLHWRIHPTRFPFRIDPGRLWSRPARAAVSGRDVRVFPTEILLVLLCVHGFKDRWQKLVWICDVDRLVRASPSLDWEEVRGFAEAGRCRRAVGLGLLLARRLFETPLPASVVGWLAPDERLARLAARVEGALQAGGITRPWWLEPLNVWPFHVALLDSWRDRALYVGRTLVTPDPGEWARLEAWMPDALLPLWLPAHLVRRLASLAGASFRRALGATGR